MAHHYYYPRELVELPSWPELLGSNHWSGLSDPLHVTLRNLILLCGDLCQVTYDSFNSDENSRYCGSCRYGKDRLFHKTLFPGAGNIKVVEYIYATSKSMIASFHHFSLSREKWCEESNWMGYIAVSTDEATEHTGQRVIFLAFRGTIRDLEWVDVIQPEHVKIREILSHDGDDHDHPKIMKGWHVIYTERDERSPFSRRSARDQIIATIRKLVRQYDGENLSIVLTGHSLGGALATVAAFDITLNALPEGSEIPVTAILFGSPQVGNRHFREKFDSIPNLRVLRVKNKHDRITIYPSEMLGFHHVGDELLIDSRKSPFLKEKGSTGDYHNLQMLLHVVNGWHGEHREFKTVTPRSIALVNKSCSFLKEENLVPGSWWVEKNKGMVLTDDGSWELVAPTEEDHPRAPTLH